MLRAAGCMALTLAQGRPERGTRLLGSSTSQSSDDEHDQRDRRRDDGNRRQDDHKMREAAVVHARSLLAGQKVADSYDLQQGRLSLHLSPLPAHISWRTVGPLTLLRVTPLSG
jgi:hypothetical protein